MSNSGRACVFCGSSPQDNTPEHPLPRWLIELTGDPRRVVQVGFDWTRGKAHRFAFQAFTAPSCRRCNNARGTLENATKPVVKALLVGSPITLSQVETLLDWLDKVRIATWLTARYLDSGKLGFTPTFAVDGRTAKADRMLCVYRFDAPTAVGLSFIGLSPLFMYMPSCFCLKINNVVLLNASMPFMLARRAGYPFPLQKGKLHPSGASEIHLHPGTHEIRHPLLNRRLSRASLRVSQVLVDTHLQEQGGCWEEGYEVENAINAAEGRGPLIVSDDHRSRFLHPSDVLDVPFCPLLRHSKRLAQETLDLQNYLATESCRINDLGSHKKFYDELIKINLKWIPQLEPPFALEPRRTNREVTDIT
jgi:hypothetical protein